MALAGLILGYLGMFLVLAAIAIPAFLSQRAEGARSDIQREVQALVSAENTYYVSHGSFADLETLSYASPGTPTVRLIRQGTAGLLRRGDQRPRDALVQLLQRSTAEHLLPAG